MCELETWKIKNSGFRAFGRSESPRVPVLFVGLNLPPLVDIGLTDLQNSGGAMAPPAPPGTTGLLLMLSDFLVKVSKYLLT